MAEVRSLSDHRRGLITDGDRSALRATWHDEAGYAVLSLWRGDTFVATSHLTPAEAGRLATSITYGLADLAQAGMFTPTTVTPIAPQFGLRHWVHQAGKSWRASISWSLEKIGRRLRTFE